MNFEQQVRHYADSFPFERIRIAQFHQIDLAAVEQGICVVFAAWSGSSIVSFKLLCDALMAHPDACFPVYVVDIDEVDLDSFKRTCAQSLNGNGETVWIKRGRVIAVDIGYTNKPNGKLQNVDVLRQRIKLLSSP